MEIINKGAITIDHIHSNTIEDVRTSGLHLSLEERGMIQALHRRGLSLRNIAAAVGCAHTTVFYELRHGTPEQKKASTAQPLSIWQNAGISRTQRIAKTPGTLLKSTMTTASHSSNGW